jgi:hypothetical protein
MNIDHLRKRATAAIAAMIAATGCGGDGGGAGGSSEGVTQAGFYELTLPEPVESVDLRLRLAAAFPTLSDSFRIVFSVADGDVVGPSSTTEVEVLPSPLLQDIEINVSWDAASDIDIHVVDPSGREIFYGNPFSLNEEGMIEGFLDAQANPGCFVRVEGFVEQVTTFTDGVTIIAGLLLGTPPAANGGPTIMVDEAASTSGGGQVPVSIASTAPFDRVLVAVDSSGPPRERVVWAPGRAPRGTYTVRLDYFDDCGAMETNYVVTITRAGQSTLTFDGQFRGSGSGGGFGDGIEIARFDF